MIVKPVELNNGTYNFKLSNNEISQLKTLT